MIVVGVISIVGVVRVIHIVSKLTIFLVGVGAAIRVID